MDILEEKYNILGGDYMINNYEKSKNYEESKNNCIGCANVSAVNIQKEDSQESSQDNFQEHITQFELNNGIYEIHSIFNQEKTRKEILKDLIMQAYMEQYLNYNSVLDLLK